MHAMQPLDVGVFKSIKTHYNQLAQSWMRDHPGSQIKECDVPFLFYEAFKLGGTVKNAVNAFKKCGIHPFDAAAVNVDTSFSEYLQKEKSSNVAVEMGDICRSEASEKEDTRVGSVFVYDYAVVGSSTGMMGGGNTREERGGVSEKKQSGEQ